jgi:hypothetical protein
MVNYHFDDIEDVLFESGGIEIVIDEYLRLLLVFLEIRSAKFTLSSDSTNSLYSC